MVEDVWQPELGELEKRLEFAREMGGAEAVARHHERGRLTARERIDLLADPGSFREFMALIGTAAYDNGDLVGFTPKPHVDGTCTIGGRKVVVTAMDFTVRGGSGGAVGALGMEPGSNVRAREWRLPYVRLLDAAGGSVGTVEEIGRTYLPDGNIWSQTDVELLSRVPVVSAVLGPAAGAYAVNVCLSHWSVIVKGVGQVFPGGPPVVKAALGYDVSKEDLGGWEIHARVSGVVDNVADTEEDACEQVRRFLSYLPASVDEIPRRMAATDPPDRRDDELLSLVPRDRRKPFDARRLIDAVVDRDSFFEISPLYGQSRITGFARVDGYPVGLMANNPMHLGGGTDVAAGEKSVRLIRLCDTFHLPLVSFADEPGFLVGTEAEKQGIERAGARLVCAVCESRMPWITFVVRRLYGVAGQCHHRPSGMFRRYAWPSAHWGSMHIEGGASAAYRRAIESAEDPDAKRQEIEERLRALASPFRTAEATGQDIIDPRETRPLLAEFVRDAQRVLATQVGPPLVPYRP